jgi:hypothetical protein
MLKKLRRRFTSAATAAFFAVTLVLLLALNLWNFVITTSRQDSSIDGLVVQEHDAPPQMSAEPPRETQYMLRYFSVRYSDTGDLVDINQDNIASVTSDEAESYAEKILARGKTRGYYKGYRYLVSRDELGVTVVFLNSEREIQAMETIFALSGIIALVCLGAVLILVAIFSKRAIEPYIRNMETQKQFITDAGHELKTPLTAISTSADVLAMEEPDNEWVKNIRSQTERLSRLISELVTLSRLDEAQPFPEKQDFSLSEAVWEISEPFESMAEARGLEYVRHIEDGVVINGDRAAIQQTVSILLDNAVRYSDSGGKIRLDVKKRQKKAEISVYNTCQLDENIELDRLFDRFYRPDRSRSQSSGGTGIGLSIARATIEAHGGTLTAETHGGGNITFTAIV